MLWGRRLFYLGGVPRFLLGGIGGVALCVTDGVGVILRRCLVPTGRELCGTRTRGATSRGSEPLRVEIPDPEPEPEPLLVARYLFCRAGAC